jgi:hypothetical protein
MPPNPEPRPATEEDMRYTATLEALLQRMNPRHAELVKEELGQWAQARARRGRHACSNLLFAVFHYITGHLEAGTPLELPTAVAAVYLQDPEASPQYDCEDCGYDVPFAWADTRSEPPKPPTVYFERCPLCGGKTGWHAFYFKQGRYKSKHQPARHEDPNIAAPD